MVDLQAGVNIFTIENHMTANLQGLFEPVADDLQAFDQTLDRILQSESPLIGSIARHLLAKKGKRLRPAFSFLVARAAQLNHPRLVEAALAVELIHSATLLHDDVVDESQTRRSQPTVNARWNNLTAVLMGDFLFAKAFKLLVATDSPRLIQHVSLATEQVAYGELRQIEEAFNWGLSEADYLEIIRDKTAALFAAAAVACAILNDVNGSDSDRFLSFGEKIGTAFQISDDILDLVGERSKAGKDLGLDILQGKVTLPLIHALRLGGSADSGAVLNILNDGLSPESLGKILEFIRAQGGVEYAYRRASVLAEGALEFVDSFPRSRSRECLQELVRFSINRDR